MNTYTDKTKENKNQSLVNRRSDIQRKNEETFQFVNNRPEAAIQRKLQDLADNSRQAAHFQAFQTMMDNSIQQKQAHTKPALQMKSKDIALNKEANMANDVSLLQFKTHSGNYNFNRQTIQRVDGDDEQNQQQQQQQNQQQQDDSKCKRFGKWMCNGLTFLAQWGIPAAIFSKGNIQKAAYSMIPEVIEVITNKIWDKYATENLDEKKISEKICNLRWYIQSFVLGAIYSTLWEMTIEPKLVKEDEEETPLWKKLIYSFVLNIIQEIMGVLIGEIITRVMSKCKNRNNNVVSVLSSGQAGQTPPQSQGENSNLPSGNERGTLPLPNQQASENLSDEEKGNTKPNIKDVPNIRVKKKLKMKSQKKGFNFNKKKGSQENKESSKINSNRGNSNENLDNPIEIYTLPFPNQQASENLSDEEKGNTKPNIKDVPNIRVKKKLKMKSQKKGSQENKESSKINSNRGNSKPNIKADRNGKNEEEANTKKTLSNNIGVKKRKKKKGMK